MNWLKEMLLKKYLKRALDKLPFNGSKTFLGIILLVLSSTLYAFPHLISAEVAEQIIKILKQFGADDYSQMTLGTAIAGAISFFVGIVHKGLKKADGVDGGGGEGKERE